MRRLAVITAVLALVAPAAARSGVNPQIAGLQVALRARGLYLAQIDGIAGPRTARAVHAFQRRFHLPVGVVDRRTRIALGPLGVPLFGSRTLRIGDFGWDVSVLQFLLTRARVYDGALDGYFGKQTSASLRRYQRKLHLTADAVVGPRTLSAFVRLDHVPVEERPATTTAPAPRVSLASYVVRAGDSLTAIARTHGTTLAKLAALNHLDPARPIVIGQRLRVPVAAGPSARSPAAKTAVASYVVRAGDSLTAIARTHGTTLAKLAALNHLDPARPIVIGQRLRVPAAPAHAPAAVSPPATASVASYVVHAGDSLTAIAARYVTTVPQLASLNGIDPAHPIVVGQTLRIPQAGNAPLGAQASEVQAKLDAWSARLGVDAHLVRALAWMESGFQTSIVSPAGAVGVLQTLPTTRAYVESVLNGSPIPHTVDGDIEVGILYLRHLLQVFDGNQSRALAGWYQGERAVRQDGVYAETKPFVADVLALAQRM